MGKKRATSKTETTKTVTIKCGLASRCRILDAFFKINEDVIALSRLFIEYAIYMQFKLMKEFEADIFPQEKINFLDGFYRLSIGNKEQNIMNSHYRKIRRRAGLLEQHDTSHRQNQVKSLCYQYEINFRNNIWMHAWNRLNSFFKIFEKQHNIRYDTLHYLFVTNSTKQPSQLLINEMEHYLDYNGERLTNMRSQYFKYIRIFYKLQRYNEDNGLKNFALIPIVHHGRKHIRYDTYALFQMHNALQTNKREKGNFPFYMYVFSS